MHLHDHFGDTTWLLAGLGGLALALSQACANGKSNEGEHTVAVTGGAPSSQAGAVSTGGAPSQGGNNNAGNTSYVATGGTGEGGSATGGSNGVATGGQGDATGGADEGGNAATGGDSNTESSGGSATGGSNTGGIMATGGTPGISCQSSLDCVTAPSGQTICDTTKGICVQCVGPADCGASVLDGGTAYECSANKCSVYNTCTTSADCPNNRACDSATSRCVDCMVDGDCGSGEKCLSQKCRLGCASDNDCTPSGMLCNATAGYCVECNSVLKCKAGLVCDPTGQCGPPVCNSGDKTCVNNGVASCKSDGSGFDPALPCPANSTCKAASGTVACFGNGGDGGIVDNCAVGGDPCKQIPQLTVTQVVDGVGDDLCAVPAVQFDKDHAAKVIVYHATPPEIAKVRVAWTSAALSVFVDVQDASVQTVYAADPTQAVSKIYQGDSIELMISSSNNVTGLTGTDSNTLHVTIPASGPAVQVKTSNQNGASQGAYTTLPTSEYAQKITATGYAIEMRLPWPGSAPSAGTAVRFDIALNSADKTFSSVDDMRDGQLIYYLGTVAGTTTCQGTGGDGTVPFCDDRTWCGTPLQN